jgi:hypothetical protein
MRARVDGSAGGRHADQGGRAPAPTVTYSRERASAGGRQRAPGGARVEVFVGWCAEIDYSYLCFFPFLSTFSWRAWVGARERLVRYLCSAALVKILFCPEKEKKTTTVVSPFPGTVDVAGVRLCGRKAWAWRVVPRRRATRTRARPWHARHVTPAPRTGQLPATRARRGAFPPCH